MKRKVAVTQLAYKVNKRNKKDFDTVGGITGDEGVGKTDLLILLGLLINGFTLDQIYKPTDGVLKRIEKFFRNNMLYVHNAEEIERVIEGVPRYEFIGVDEGMMILYKYEHATKRQRELKKYFATCRKDHNNAIFFCMQDFNDFTKFFRNRRIKVWIHVVDRGKAVVMLRGNNPVSDDKWNLKEFTNIYSEAESSSNIFEKLVFLCEKNRYSPYWSYVTWNKLPKKIRSLYDKIRLEIKELYGVEDEDEDQVPISWFANLCIHLNEDRGISFTKLADIAGGSCKLSTLTWKLRKYKKNKK